MPRIASHGNATPTPAMINTIAVINNASVLRKIPHNDASPAASSRHHRGFFSQYTQRFAPGQKSCDNALFVCCSNGNI